MIFRFNNSIREILREISEEPWATLLNTIGYIFVFALAIGIFIFMKK